LGFHIHKGGFLYQTDTDLKDGEHTLLKWSIRYFGNHSKALEAPGIPHRGPKFSARNENLKIKSTSAMRARSPAFSATATDDLVRAKQRLNAFLLRTGFNYTGKSKWTIADMRYLRELTMLSDTHKIVLEESIQAIDGCELRLHRPVTKMKQLLEHREWKPVVLALLACRGFQEVAP
jgi:hypothetical protein